MRGMSQDAILPYQAASPLPMQPPHALDQTPFAHMMSFQQQLSQLLRQINPNTNLQIRNRGPGIQCPPFARMGSTSSISSPKISEVDSLAEEDGVDDLAELEAQLQAGKKAVALKLAAKKDEGANDDKGANDAADPSTATPIAKKPTAAMKEKGAGTSAASERVNRTGGRNSERETADTK